MSRLGQGPALYDRQYGVVRFTEHPRVVYLQLLSKSRPPNITIGIPLRSDLLSLREMPVYLLANSRLFAGERATVRVLQEW